MIIHSEITRTVRLYGVLGATFGRKFDLVVESPKEAIRALCVILPGFERFLNTSKQRGLTYAVFSGKRNIDSDEMAMDNSTADIRIAPVIIGSKRGGLFQTILGIALIAAAAFPALTPGLSIAASNILFQVGGAIAIGGVIQMLSPQATGLASKQSSDNKASYAFGSPTNTTAQGNPVPLLYGQRLIGGAIISAGIYVEDQQ